MNQTSLYPLRFEPIFQYRLWGGQQFAGLLTAPQLAEGPVGEAWLLSDRDEQSSVIADGLFKGQTLRQLLAERPDQMWGIGGVQFKRFPLLLKFLDVRGSLSVQVHPSDRQTEYLPAGESGKAEAWVVLEAGSEARVYAGLVPYATKDTVREALNHGAVAGQIASFAPKVGDGVFIPAGAVHSLRNTVVFEVQENSDVTFRLFDWDHVDAKTRQPRPLQVEQAMACIEFTQRAIGPVVPSVESSEPVLHEKLVACEHFSLWRTRSMSAFVVGASGRLRVLVCIDGSGQIHHGGVDYACCKGDVLLLPAEVGECSFEPDGSVTVLEVGVPARIDP